MYIERFATDGAVFVRWRNGNTYFAGALNVAVEGGLYDLTQEDGTTSVELEGVFSQLEGHANKVLRSIDATGTAPVPGSEERSVLAEYLALQVTRTPQERERLLFHEQVRAFLAGRPITLGLVTEYLRDYLGFEPSASEARAAFELSEFVLREPPTSHDLAIRILLRSAENIVPALDQLHWCVETDRKGRFVTADAPLTLWRTPSKRDQFEGFGVGNCEEVRFPLDAHKQLVLSRVRRPGSARITRGRVAACNQDAAYACHRFLIAPPEHEERTRALDLPAKRPVLRFDVGPMMKQDASGRYYDTGEEILHTWVPRR